ncbi:hypothetical protein [Streptosporangium sp. NPDC001681]|uniref:hypothetical protein n=1 Tax=Streptosporangium sp. NPDC001681 TaxID=3154395 RepID=UPI00331A760D
MTAERNMPFGNSGRDVYDDIAEIMDGRKGPHDPAQEARYDRLSGELALVLGIVLQSGRFEPGHYVRPSASGGWRLVPDKS